MMLRGLKGRVSGIGFRKDEQQTAESDNRRKNENKQGTCDSLGINSCGYGGYGLFIGIR
jgi:hypothetical protein